MRSFTALVAGLAVAAALGACQKSASTTAAPDDMSMGSPSARVTMVEYASVACIHCAKFNNEVFPTFKAKYIDTGKVHYIAREALTGDPAIAAAGFLTARCAGKDKYFQVTDAIYHGLEEMERGGQPHTVLLNIARSAGLTDAQFDACIKDEKALNAFNTRAERNMKDNNINGTPTFVINGKVYDKGEMTMQQLDAAVAEAQAGGKATS